MVANGKDFSVLFPLYDITIANLAPNTNGTETQISGTIGAADQDNFITITPNTIPGGTSQLPSGLAAEALIPEVISPIVSNGGALVYPDFAWWPAPDGTDLKKYLHMDGSYGGNMTPPWAQTKARPGEEPLTWGVALDRLLEEAIAGHPRKNMPLAATGLKYNTSFQTKLASSRGWGPGVAGDTVVRPGRIRIWGKRYTKGMLAKLAQGFRGRFKTTTLRRILEASGNDPITAFIQGVQAGMVDLLDFPGLPGGWNQTVGQVVMRYLNFAYNAADTSNTDNYFLTNSQQAYGTPNQVTTYSGDLGYAFAPTGGEQKNARTAVVFKEAGVVGGVDNLAYFGVQVGGAIVPDPDGWPVSQGVVRQAYGQVSPQGTGEEYYRIPKLEGGELDIYGENAAWFVTPDGAAIAAGTAAVAVGGIYVDGLGTGVTASGVTA